MLSFSQNETLTHFAQENEHNLKFKDASDFFALFFFSTELKSTHAMKITLHIYFTFAIVIQQSRVMSWWPFSSESSRTNEQGRALQSSPVPFEMTDAEEKFLAEARQYMSNLSPLDSCHHIVS